MNELDTITIRGFRSIDSIEALRLRPINVVIGPNGSGKSNFVGVFAFLHAVREGRLQDYVSHAGGANKVLHYGAKHTAELYIHVSFREGWNQYAITLKPTRDDRLYPSQESAYFWPDKRSYAQPYEERLTPRGPEAGISDPACEKTAAHVRQHLAKWRLYHFHDTSVTSPMKRTADLNDNRYLRSDAANLAAFLYLLKHKHSASYKLICAAVRQVAPFFEEFRLEPSELNADKLRLEWVHKGSDDYFDASSLSDGTLRFIAMATLFLQPESYRPSVVVVDEPELGLHPFAIEMLASLVRQASVKTQVILATQSALLLDHFEPEDVLVADRVGGGTRLTRLESEKLRSWLEEYSLGELWEKNEFGGRPSREDSDG